ncbi:MAG: ABC transporter ATP-binding protein [Candidatus Paraimprobicoccus trichonymphae]|uniref:ABC transporter ATP-binding protein n=1 Tax=Candidatus Paraimprobicoccus trichonymphae TaxID=3033793 RepID=A0AA48L1B6_9FIRM|nr:MAG: ABC transporter ATP-binding protein [Candidatus Paraimprobicoccus trichonymphae]
MNKRKKIVELKNISKRFHTLEKETLAVDDVSFDIYEREFLTIIGPSGCGKSTVFSLISGLIKPSYGKIYINGRTQNPLVAYMLQQDYLLDWRTVEQNVVLGLEVKKTLSSETSEYTKNLLKIYGLGKFLNHHPNQLSGGMRQKVALIRTLAIKPEILLLDEPFSALDYQTRLSISEEIREIIKKEKKTAILITHDISEAISLSDRVVVFSNRPSKVKKIINVEYPEKNLTQSEKRKCKCFNEYFEMTWKELTENE